MWQKRKKSWDGEEQLRFTISFALSVLKSDSKDYHVLQSVERGFLSLMSQDANRDTKAGSYHQSSAFR